MSTEFRSEFTDRLAFARFFAGRDRGACLEFGTVSQFERVRVALVAGSGSSGRPASCST